MTEKYFYGHQVSDYGLENGYVDYRTFAKALSNIVLCNDIIEIVGFENFEAYNIDELNEEGEYEYRDIFQWYIVSPTEFNKYLLNEYHECYLYNEEHDILVWGVDHYGTSWDYVLTNIKLIKD